ncbi:MULTISPECIES: helix-turn-helix domain-containing protein [Arthrobacter]|uniref:HTH cro/C1-type domain-containing protein n=1 Tax=Arthrobacter terricola TaxID=2547396 RepID=A0A4R5KQ90_9MICC|nr:MULTISPECIES: helix-turn-helix domain-containing protein [Arthrobacter]MBT8161048.1 helix-turn-helix transcriptional regulator [Arthrobacter sp. GN70]TDF96907.1 hypothetical protein E1809_09300 [Arthrobacter terricola]
MGTNIAEIVSATNRNIALGIVEKNTNRNVLAKASGIPRTTFDRKLDGHADFTLKELGQIAQALGLHLGQILPVQLIKAPDAA